ncbi:MAG: M48 family metallopeptidase [Verrucomicrobiales bacterium]|nr:M48 family metallopeptidase [Verrucomicrobiales bacterium]
MPDRLHWVKPEAMQVNAWFIVIVVSLVVLWKVDLVATLLNLKALGPEIPVALREVVDQDAYLKSQDYTRAKAVLGIGEGVVSLLVLFLFWWLGGFGWLDEKVRACGYGPIATGLLFIGTLVVGLRLLNLPFDLYDTFSLEERFGFNKTTLAIWFADLAKGAVLGALIGLPLLALLLWVFQTVPMAWLWGWLLVTVFSLLLAYVAPTWIMPLFNQFKPLEDGSLKQAIHEMSEKCAFPIKEVSVMDGSKRSAKSNAFFTGFGNNKRIALFDTLIENHTEAELVGVLAHEIGHFKKNHIVKSLIVGILTTGAMLFLLGLMINNRSLFDAFGVRETSVYVSLVLFGILISPVSEVLSIAGNWMSRKHEFEADAYAAEVTGNPQAMADALLKLSRDNLSNLTPHPFYVFLNYSHPPAVERIAALKAPR